MKELHNHLFSNTTCISKETMLKYINKQLSKKELYEVEKHMLDCELCTDAFEGMKLAENSSILFAIDNKIDLRLRGVGRDSHLMKNLMIAASVLVIVFGSYFTFNFYNNSFLNEDKLALREEKPNTDQLPIQENKNVENAVAEDREQEELQKQLPVEPL